MTVVAGLFSLTLSLTVRGTTSHVAARWLAIWTFWIPVLQAVMQSYSGRLGPTVGAVVDGIVSGYTVLMASAYVAAGM